MSRSRVAIFVRLRLASGRRIALLVGLFATLIGGLAGVAHWSKRDPTSDELLLQRHIASVHLHNATADVAIAQLQRLIGVAIVVKWDFDRDQRFWLDFDDISVHDLLQAFAEQARGLSRMDFDAKNNRIWIAPNSELACSMRIYDVSDLRKEAPAPTQPGGIGDEITEGVRFLAEERYWSPGAYSFAASAPQKWLYQDSTRLYVLQTSAAQMEIARLLNGVRQARRDGSGPCISRSRVLGEDSTTRIIRFYDVRDLTGRVEYLPAVEWRGGNYTRNGAGSSSRIDLLAFAISVRCSPESWMSAAQIWSMCGRLVIEQTPEVHTRIRAMLADLRDGRAVEGFYVTHAKATERAR